MFKVIRTTTDKLESSLNETDGPPREITWIGGRDWIVVYDVIVSDSSERVGWVADQGDRHRRARAQQAACTPGNVRVDITAQPGLVDPEVEWGDLRYGRYDETLVDPAFTGWVEDHARSWIIFLGPHGAPALYWPRRDAEGGVIGRPVTL